VDEGEGSKSSLSGAKRLLGLCVLIVVAGGSVWIGHALSRRMGSPGVSIATTGPAAMFLLIALCIVSLTLGVATYGLVLITGVLTFRYNRPIFSGVKKRLWLANIIVGLFLQGGFALLVGVPLVAMLVQVLPEMIAVPLSFFTPFFAAQVAMIWVTVWGPVERIVIDRRLAALGVPAAALAEGVYVGLSDPGRSSFRKFTTVEDDVGMLWFGPDQLVYRGDSQSWQIARDQLLDVERKADAGSTSSYFGAVHVIVRLRDDTGAERRWRLHPEGQWNMSARARWLDRLAAALEAWREGHVPSLHNRTAGFEVRVSGQTGSVD
jgi:hypothetical protein